MSERSRKSIPFSGPQRPHLQTGSLGEDPGRPPAGPAVPPAPSRALAPSRHGSTHCTGFRGPSGGSPQPRAADLLPPPASGSARCGKTGSRPRAPETGRETQPRGAPRPTVLRGRAHARRRGGARPGGAQGRAGPAAGARAAPGGGGGGGSGEGGGRPAQRWCRRRQQRLWTGLG